MLGLVKRLWICRRIGAQKERKATNKRRSQQSKRGRPQAQTGNLVAPLQGQENGFGHKKPRPAAMSVPGRVTLGPLWLAKR